MRVVSSILLASIVSLVAGKPAAAETVEEFYRGKTITMYVGTGVGAGVWGSCGALGTVRGDGSGAISLEKLKAVSSRAEAHSE